MTNDQEDPFRLNAIGNGCSEGVEPDSKLSNPITAAAELIKVEEGSSNRRPSRRASRRASIKRSSLRWSARSSATSLQSSFNFNDSVTSKGSMMGFGDSANMMYFGASQRLAVLDESLRGCALDETICIRSYASLDEFLDQWKEDFVFDNSDEAGRESVGNLDGSIRSEGDLDDYVDSYDGLMNQPSTQETEVGGCGRERVAGANGSFLNDPAVEGRRDEDEEKNKTTSQTSQEISSSRRPSRRRSFHRQSRRRSSRHGSQRMLGNSSAGSLGLGSSFNVSDSLVSESGFMGWPSAAQEEIAGDLNEDGADANDTIQEEYAK